MKLWICMDGVKTWLLCHVIGSMAPGAVFSLNPVFHGTNVLSVLPDGSYNCDAPAGTNGAYQQFIAAGDFILITPDQPPVKPTSLVFGFKWVAA